MLTQSEISDHLVKKYYCADDLIICEVLFLKGDEIYIQSYDPVNGRPQSVFTKSRQKVGEISADFFWNIKKFLINIHE